MTDTTPGQVSSGRLRQAMKLIAVDSVTDTCCERSSVNSCQQMMKHIVESYPLTKHADGGLLQVHCDDENGEEIWQ